MPWKFFLVLFMVNAGLLKPAFAGDILKVGLLAKDRPPFYMASDSGGELRGIYIDLLKAAFAGADVEFDFHRLPQTRLRLMMEEGSLDLEPGIDKRWRSKPVEVSGSVYSEPFMEDAEILVFSADDYRDDIAREQLQELIFCGVRGYAFPKILQPRPDQQEKLQKLLVLDEAQALRMLRKERCDYTLISSILFRVLKVGDDTALKAHSQPVETYQLRFRLNKKYHHLLEQVNINLAQMKQSGELQRILMRYE